MKFDTTEIVLLMITFVGIAVVCGMLLTSMSKNSLGNGKAGGAATVQSAASAASGAGR